MISSPVRHLAAVGVALTLGIAALSAQEPPAASLLDSGTMSEISAKGSASSVDSDGSPRLLPRLAAAESIGTALAAERPKVLVEALFLYPRPEPPNEDARRAELARIFGLMRSISTLKGIQYYSQSQKSMQILYVDSYRVADPTGDSPLADESPPPPGAIPSSERLFAFLQDQRFGKNIYRYDLTTLESGILVESTNETRMSYSIIPVFAPGQLKMRLLVLPTREGILFYVESGADAPGFLRGHIGESFKNRATALFGWFRDNFGAQPRP